MSSGMARADPVRGIRSECGALAAACCRLRGHPALNKAVLSARAFRRTQAD